MREKRDNFDNNFYAIVIESMKRSGRKFDKCELCGKELNGKFDLHHTRYEKASIYDLLVVCRKCNTQTVNKGLK